MARIALMVGIAVAGALTGGLAAAGLLPFGFAGGAGALTGALMGGAIGASVGGVLGGLLFPGHMYSYGARLNDLQISSSANGASYPWGYGGFRIGGQIIWSPGLVETTTRMNSSAKGGPQTTTITYTYTISFAAAFCQGPATITRVWMDSRLVYDTTTKGATADAKFDTGIPNRNPNIINTAVVLPTVYPGSETQQPDPTIQASEGIDATPAFRNTCYLVYTDLPLASFGNRLPNVRGEISVSTTLAYLKDTYPGQGISGTHILSNPTYSYVDSTNRKAYIVDAGNDAAGQNIQQINLVANDTAPLNVWQPSVTYAVGDEILDSNGNVEIAVSISDPGVTSYVDPRNNQRYPAGPGMSGGPFGGPMLSDIGGNPVTGWAPEGETTADPNPFAQPFHTPPILWRNLGVGPEAITIASQGTLTPALDSGETVISGGYGKAANIAIDPYGSIWQVVYIGSGANGVTLQCYDPTSFVAKYRIIAQGITHNSGVQQIAFAQISSGTFMYVSCLTGIVLIYKAVNGRFVFLTSVDMFQEIGEPAWPANYIAAAPNGHVYAAYAPSGGGFSTDTYVSDYNPITGSVSQSANLYSAIGGSASLRQLFAVLWNPVDSSLIAMNHAGRLVKIDPVSLSVISTTADGAIQPYGGNTIDPAYVTQNGVLPASGILHGFRLISSNVWNAVGYDNDLNRVLDIPVTQWFINVDNNQGFTPNGAWHDYDPATDSLVVTSPGSAIYGASSYRIFLNRQAVSASDLGAVVVDLLTRAGIDPTRVDVSRIAGQNVLGLPVTQNTSVKSLLMILCQAFYFDIVESDFKLVCVPRGGAVAQTIPENDLGLISEQYKLQETIAQENDLPKDITVLYADPSIDYQQGKALQQRNSRVKKTKNHTVLELPLTMNSDTAAQLANKALKTVWQERNSYDFKLWKYQYLALDPTDVIQFTYEGMVFSARLVKESIGVNLAMEISAVSEDAASYLSIVNGNSGDGFVKQYLDPVGPTLLFMFDIPLLQDTDASPDGSTGYYWGMSSIAQGWPGAAIFASPDGETWNSVGFSSVGMPFGSAFDALAAPASPWLWDTKNTFTVAINSGSVSSTSALNVLNGANAALLGDEVLQYQTVAQNANGTYTLSNLLRGRRGTEWACNQHQSGETFIVLNGTDLQRNIVSTAILGQARQYKAVTVGLSIDQVQPQAATLTGMDLRPYAPAQFVSPLDGNGNFNFSWVRRTRLGGAWLDGTGTVPLAEEAESYDLDIMYLDGGGKNIPMYELSAQSVGGVFPILDHNRLVINPFTITWADGHTANYLGTIVDPYNLGSAVNAVVQDPNRTGEAPGRTVPYLLETPAWAHFSFANSAGYYLLGSLPPATNAIMGPGGSDVPVRTLRGVSATSLIYTTAQQLIDFVTYAGPLAHPWIFPGYVRAKVYQNSAAVGRGFAAENIDQAGGEIFVFNGSTNSGDATSLNGIPIIGMPVPGQVLEFNGTSWVPANAGGSATRASASVTTGSLTNGQTQTGTLTLSKTIALLAASTNRDVRVRLYETAAYRTADASRPLGINPLPGSLNGIIADFVLTASQGTWDFSPPLLGSNRDGAPASTIYYSITNLGTTGAITVGFTYLPLET